jgi:poly(A) polymerase
MFKKLSKVFTREQRSTGKEKPADSNSGNMRSDRQSNKLANVDSDKVRIIERENHGISRRDISSGALKILYQLGDAGHQAFLVGGSVRDLLLGNRPKDFDIATDATPEQLKQLFRSARIIGRRFKLVHIRFGREVIEVTTFRAHHEALQEFGQRDDSRQFRHLDSAHSSSGMILRDNVYGDINDDAARRDFTVNSLYYTINNFRLLDFSNGIKDIENRLIRIIGDPVTRYKEDPVRMLRAIRFAAKLGFTIEESTSRRIDDLAYLLESVSTARLFDESLKLLCTGHGEKTFTFLCQYKIGEYLFPDTVHCFKQGDSVANRLLTLALRSTDQRLSEEKSVTPAFLFAALLWPVLQDCLRREYPEAQYSLPELQVIADQVISRQLDYTAIPRRFTLAAREIWELQLRLTRLNRRGVIGAWQHPRFRAAYDFLLLRGESGEDLKGIDQWWTEFLIGDKNRQEEMLGALSHGKKARRRSKRRSRGMARDSNK